MRKFIFIWILTFLIANSSVAQRSNYYSYLSEKLNFYETGQYFQPSIFSSQDGGFFLADNGKFNHIRLTKFKVSGEKDWEKYISFPYDGLEFYTLKENVDGKLIVLAKTNLSRNWYDGICFILNQEGDVLQHSYIIPNDRKINNRPQDFSISGDTLFFYGNLEPLTFKMRPCGFYSMISMKTGEMLFYKEFPKLGFAYEMVHLISRNNSQTQFAISIRDTARFKTGDNYLGLLKIDHFNDTFNFYLLKDSFGLIFPVKFENLEGYNEYIGMNVHFNSFDSSSILVVSHNTIYPLSDDVISFCKFDKNGVIVKTKSSYLGQGVLTLASNFEGKIKTIPIELNLLNNKERLLISDLDSNLNEINKVSFFIDSKSFENFILNEDLREGLVRLENLNTNVKPNLIFDRQGDLIFCSEVLTKDSGFVTKILVVKLNSKGELITLNKISDYNNLEFDIFPNPCRDIVTINLPNELNFFIELYDINGKIHKKYEVTGTVNLNLEDILPGPYLVRIIEEKTYRQYLKKLIKL